MVDIAERVRPRILVIDDNRAIHDDFRKILTPEPDAQGESLAPTEDLLFGCTAPAAPAPPRFELDSAFQGREGWDLVRQAVQQGRPYVLAFVDVRMPPGWDGVQTIAHLWEEDSELHAVICTAYTDYSWKQVIERLGETDRLLILKKPFDPIEIRQLACALTLKSRAAPVRRRGRALKSVAGRETARRRRPAQRSPTVARRFAPSHFWDGLFRSEHPLQTEPDQINIRHGSNDFAHDHDALCQHRESASRLRSTLSRLDRATSSSEMRGTP